MLITLYIVRREESWRVVAPQLMSGCKSATLEEARRETIAEALESLAYYYKRGRFSEEDVREVRFIEVETTMTSKELADLQPEWYKEICRKRSQEVAAE
jgi:hypothetical protein